MENLINSFESFLFDNVLDGEDLVRGINLPNNIDFFTGISLAFNEMKKNGFDKDNKFSSQKVVSDSDLKLYFESDYAVFKSFDEYHEFIERAIDQLVSENIAYINGVGSTVFALWLKENRTMLKDSGIKIKYSDVQDCVQLNFKEWL